MNLTSPEFEARPLLLVDCEARTLAALEKSLPRMGVRWLTAALDGPPPEEPLCAALVELEHFASPRLLASLNQAGLPIVALTSHEALSQIQRAIDLGATALLPKPINQRAIYTTLMMAVGLRQQLNEDSRNLSLAHRRLDFNAELAQTLAALMVERDLDERQAYAWLRGESMRTNRRIEDICRQRLGQAALKRRGERG
ncbi:ANTAR domain-containing protein [Sodalis ligni]|uniref:Response regulator receiver and ANTAR domain protein n=1 Tax=Sodalis ligni TaxID=2697027 RepID=A0A4R1N8X3_9GAMM|nr:ANTAR domain-containing protein [Sodalis ligni]QWA13243.1 ANTAR domain-containing protein [Sodalis ligni]TCL03107.1 response regulator receiver and ANTAR domain protein [Sodalis ligni]